MKKFILLAFIFFTSCNQQLDTEGITDTPTDTLLLNSEKNLKSADTLSQKTDSITKEKVVKIVKEIRYLNTEVEKFRTEKLTLENQLKVVTEKVIYRVDTVFIETQKNFWGKKKTTTTVNSDSTVVESLDSLQSSLEKIDTLNLYQYLY